MQLHVFLGNKMWVNVINSPTQFLYNKSYYALWFRNSINFEGYRFSYYILFIFSNNLPT